MVFTMDSILIIVIKKVIQGIARNIFGVLENRYFRVKPFISLVFSKYVGALNF
jgi:hypothetical protein